jgi:hypothetical protein
MFRNNNFVNKDGQKISFGRIHQKRWPGEIHDRTLVWLGTEA